MDSPSESIHHDVDQLNCLHRMASRIVFVLICVHAAAKVCCLCPIFARFTSPDIRTYLSPVGSGWVRILSFSCCYFFRLLRHSAWSCRIAPEDWNSTWLPAGLLVTFSLSILVLVSLRPVRAKAYDVFFWTHFTIVM